MSIKSSILHCLSIILHGETRPVVAEISYLQPNQQLKGKKIIITGGGRGLGFAMSKKFIAEGANVLIAGRNEQLLKEKAGILGCQYLPLDVQDIDSFPKFIEKADDMLGGANCLINNAGISLHEDGFIHVNEEQFNAQFDTNLKGPFFLTQCFINKCSANKINETKNILFTSSETSITVDERPYGLTKASINSLVQGLAYRYKDQGYRINAIAPGITLSDMVGKTDDSDIRLGNSRYYLPEEVAEVACFLLSDASNCLNGQILVCNEGKTINARWK